MTPTDEQLAILAADKQGGNIMINALAGTGKSATLKLMDKAHRKTEARLYLVFAKRNQLEAIEAQKEGEFDDRTAIKTFNGLGHGVWAKEIAGSINLDKQKNRTLWRLMLDEMSRDDVSAAWRNYSVVMDGWEKAKSLGYIPKGVKIGIPLIDRPTFHNAMDERPSEYAADLIDDMLRESIRRAYEGHIDFNDQIYMPALFGGTFPKFPRVMVDEYQDQSPVNHKMLERLAKGRLIGVGDPFQNIYGFRGAKAGGMAAAVEAYSMTELPLSASFRCPQAIVEAARWRVPNFRWTKTGGEVNDLDQMDGTDFPDDSTIICRNNAPLLRLAFRLISAGRSVSVVGSELGPRLVAIMKKLGDPMMSHAKAIDAIEHWREERLLMNSKSANDLADCMRVFAEHGKHLSTMISYAELLFKQDGTIRLMTGHKSKGLEFDRVYFLDQGLCDSREQDQNLRYVIQTRSQNILNTIDSPSIQW
jgi:ATP-dependent DNA helicase UvrD/PcrA